MRLIRYYFDFIIAVAYVTYKEWAAYRSHMLVSLFVGPVQFYIQYTIWSAVYEGRTVINGLTLEQMVTYYGVVTIVGYLIMDFADWNLQMLVHSGKFTGYMIRPMSHRLFAFSQKIGHRTLGIMWEFTPVYLIFVFVMGITLIPDSAWAFLSIALGFVMTFFINYTLGMLCFWLTRGEGLRRMIRIFGMALSGVFIPLTFFPQVVQKILFVLPFQFSTYVPIRVFIGSYDLAGITMAIPEIVLLQAVAVIVMGCITELIWRLGVRQYTGVGV